MDDKDDDILNGINSEKMKGAVNEVKDEEIRKNIHDIYITVCVLITFTSLYLLNKYTFLCSVLIVLCILLLHFKWELLPFIFKIYKNK